MSIRAKVASLERRLGKGGVCAVCGGAGYAAYQVVSDDGRAGPPRGECPSCGRSQTLKMYSSGPEPPDPPPEWLRAV